MYKLLALFSFFFIFISCNDKAIVASESKSLSGSWNKDEVIKFEIPPLDSLKKYNIFINLRNNNEYKYNNIFLLVSINFPHGKTITDTLEYKMANPDGSWLGTGIGSVKENKLWYKENVTFSEKGIYTLNIQQAVRNNGDMEGVLNLDGITDLGYSIEKVTEE